MIPTKQLAMILSWSVLIFALFLGSLVACKVPVAPIEREACNLIQAIDPNDGRVEKICAVANDVAQIVDIVNTLRATAPSAGDSGADGGGRLYSLSLSSGTSSQPCTIVPTTNVCATNAELLVAIRSRHVARDGGLQ